MNDYFVAMGANVWLYLKWKIIVVQLSLNVSSAVWLRLVALSAALENH